MVTPVYDRDAFVVISEYENEDLCIKVFWSLYDAEDQACDEADAMGAKRVRVYRVFADPEGIPNPNPERYCQQLNVRIEHLDFDEALTTA